MTRVDRLRAKLKEVRTKVNPARVALPCIHEGGILERCHKCGGEGKHVRECDIHGKCTRAFVSAKVKACSQCADYATDEPVARPTPARVSPPFTRNLLYHMHPVPGRWQWHAHMLQAKLPLFDGRRIMAITTGNGLDRPEDVRAACPGFEFIEVKNNPALREVATFEPLFGALRPNAGDVTLYAQSKGVTRPPDHTAHRWAELLYELNCDYWPHVERLLAEYPLAGCFKKHGRGWKESASRWHYSSSWFWFRNRDLLSKNWRKIDRFWSGIEPYPSLHFSAEEAGTIFHEGKVPGTNLYSRTFMQTVIEPEYAKWGLAHELDHQPPDRLVARPIPGSWPTAKPMESLPQFRHWVIDEWTDPVDMSQLPDKEWSGWEAKYDNDCEKGKRTARHTASLPVFYQMIFERMRSVTNILEWERNLGYWVNDDHTGHGGGLHVMEPGGWLNVHLDYDRHPLKPGYRRALNLIAFLNPEWREEWGGALVLCDPLGNVKERIYPKPGRLVAFEVSDLSYHGVEKVTGPVERVTAAVYYLSAATHTNTRQRALFLPNRGKM